MHRFTPAPAKGRRGQRARRSATLIGLSSVAIFGITAGLTLSASAGTRALGGVSIKSTTDRTAITFTSIFHGSANHPAVVEDTEIFNSSGNQVAQFKRATDLSPDANGIQTIRWNASALPPGTYRIAQGLFTKNWAALIQWNSSAASIKLGRAGNEQASVGADEPATSPTTSTTATPMPAPAPVTTSTTLASGLPTTTSTTVKPVTTSTTMPAARGSGEGKFAPANGQTYIGVSTDTNKLQSWSKLTGIPHPAIYDNYTSTNGTFDTEINAANANPGVTPMVSWAVDFRNNAVTSGKDDTYLKAQAAKVKAYGKPIFIRLNWEMNGNWYGNYSTSGGVSPAQYIASWDHIHAIFAGDTNVAWIWSPNIGRPNSGKLAAFSWYPGDNEVDWIGVDAYPQYQATINSALTQTDGLNDFAKNSAAHNKPLMLAEWARGNSSLPADTPDVFNLIFNWAEANPNTVKALMYFDYPGNGHDLETHPVGLATFKSRIANSRYIYNLAN